MSEQTLAVSVCQINLIENRTMTEQERYYKRMNEQMDLEEEMEEQRKKEADFPWLTILFAPIIIIVLIPFLATVFPTQSSSYDVGKQSFPSKKDWIIPEQSPKPEIKSVHEIMAEKGFVWVDGEGFIEKE